MPLIHCKGYENAAGNGGMKTTVKQLVYNKGTLWLLYRIFMGSLHSSILALLFRFMIMWK